MEVRPATLDLLRGSSERLEAVALDASGRALTSGAFVWSSSDTAVAPVSPDGMVRAASAGTVTVTASRNGIVGSALVRVRVPPAATVTVTTAPGIRAWTSDSLIVADSGTRVSYEFTPLRNGDSVRVRLDDLVVARQGTILLTGTQSLVAELVPPPLDPAQVAAATRWMRTLDLDANGFVERMRKVVDSIRVNLRRDETSMAVLHEAGRQTFGAGPLSPEELARQRALTGTIVPVLRGSAAALRRQASSTTARSPHVLYINGIFNNKADYGGTLASLGNVLEPTALAVSGIFNPTWTSHPDYPIAACLRRVSMLVVFGASPVSLLSAALECTSLRDLAVAGRQFVNVAAGFPLEAVALADTIARRMRDMIDGGEMPILIGHSQGSLMAAEAIDALVTTVPPAFRESTVKCVVPFGLAAPAGPLPRHGEAWRGVVASGDRAFDIILLLEQNGFMRLESSATAKADVHVHAWRRVPGVNVFAALAYNVGLHDVVESYLSPAASAVWLQRSVAEAADVLRRECHDVVTTNVSRVQLRVGEQVAVQASRFSPVGTRVPAARFDWTSQQAAIASVDAQSGIVTARSVGQTTVLVESGGTSRSIAVEVLAAPPTVPQAPSALEIVRTSASSVELAWQDNATNEQAFRVERADGAAGEWRWVGTTTANVTNYVDSDVQPGRLYRYRVQAVNAVGASGFSNVIEVTTTTLPRLVVDRTLVAFAVEPGGPLPPSQIVNITNGGGGALEGVRIERISYTPSATNWLAATLSSPATPSTLSLMANPSALPVGEYEASLTLQTLQAGVLPITITVRLRVAASPPPPTPTPSIPTTLPEPLAYPNIVNTSAGIVLLGGTRNQPGPSTCAQRTDQWQGAGGGAWLARTAPPTEAGLLFASVAAVGSDVFFTGGQRCFVLSRSAYRYAAVTDTWTRLPDLPTWSVEASSVVVGNRLYVSYLASPDAGGAGPNSTLLDAYDVPSGAWVRLGAVPGGERGGFQIVAVGTRLFAIGGTGPGLPLSSRVDVYDVSSGTWTSGPPMPVARSAHQTAVLGGKIYVIGGVITAGPTFAPTARVDVFDPVTGAWSVAPSLPTPRQQGRAFVSGSQVCIAGGSDSPSWNVLTVTSSVYCLDPAQASLGWQRP